MSALGNLTQTGQVDATPPTWHLGPGPILPPHPMTEPGTDEETPAQWLKREASQTIWLWGINHPSGKDWGHLK